MADARSRDADMLIHFDIAQAAVGEALDALGGSRCPLAVGGL
jgi:hypothetical protein